MVHGQITITPPLVITRPRLIKPINFDELFNRRVIIHKLEYIKLIFEAIYLGI